MFCEVAKSTALQSGLFVWLMVVLWSQTQWDHWILTGIVATVRCGFQSVEGQGVKASHQAMSHFARVFWHQHRIQMAVHGVDNRISWFLYTPKCCRKEFDWTLGVSYWRAELQIQDRAVQIRQAFSLQFGFLVLFLRLVIERKRQESNWISYRNLYIKKWNLATTQILTAYNFSSKGVFSFQWFFAKKIF